MKKINISNWKDFEMNKLFSINPTKHHNLINKDLIEENGKNPVIVNSSYNNGVGGFTNYPITEKGNVITFSDTTTSDSIFYQPKDFVGYSHVQVLKPIIYNDKWSKECLIFFTIMFKKQASLMNYDYVNKFTRSAALKLKIKLPINEFQEPDWKYMENFIKQLETRERESTSNISKHLKQSKPNKIDAKNWKRFHLYDENLFEIFSGTKLDKKNMTTLNPSINFVGRSNLNNGIAEKVDYINGIEPYKKGDITLALGGHLGSCFIQSEEFYTSQNVNVLRAKKDISFNCKVFIITMIFKESQTYYKAFENELNRHVMNGFSILLPVDENGELDWNYMDKHISNIKLERKSILSIINNS